MPGAGLPAGIVSISVITLLTPLGVIPETVPEVLTPVQVKVVPGTSEVIS